MNEQTKQAAEAIHRYLTGDINGPLVTLDADAFRAAVGAMDSPAVREQIEAIIDRHTAHLLPRTHEPSMGIKQAEGYPPNWARLVAMVSPKGEVHAIGGDREPGEGCTGFIGLNRITTVRRERDELRAALEQITKCDIGAGGWGGPRALKIAREALPATNRAALSPSPVSTPTAEAEQEGGA